MKNQVHTIKQTDLTYPSLLREIHDPPATLSIRGTLAIPADACLLAVVGTRRATSYGREAVKRLVEPLAHAGVVIVSGLAYGIDAAAHEAALRAGGTTIAVLGTPIDQIYPPEHTQLAHRIIESGGAIISEIPSGGTVHRGTFPKRNRIIAGMCQGTLIIEATMQSGTLITARLTLEENRELFAIPGPITAATAAGPNTLIKQGATPVTEASDILSAFGLASAGESIHQQMPLLTPEQQNLMAALSLIEPIHIDNLASSATIDLPELQGELTLLELQGILKMVRPGWYIKLVDSE